jgi:hypothetical protein
MLPRLRSHQLPSGGIILIPCVPMAMTLRLTDEERDALRARATAEGISMQEAARRAVRLYVGVQSHRDRVFAAAQRVMEAHAEAIDRLGR